MSTIPLPERPNLEQLKKQARERAKSLGVRVSEAQRDLARDYGFASWPKLKRHVELVTELTREPDAVPPSSDPVDEFLRRACLTYGAYDGIARERPDGQIAAANVWAAAATASVGAVRRFAGDASKVGGPYKWEPLMYLCYSRVPMTEADALATCDALIDAGADPNVGYLWHGLPSPFTALTGALGGGEGDQPPHPHSLALARRLLERGANPNDPQTLYNRQFRDNDDHLRLLFEFGLGRGVGSVWHERLTSAIESPVVMVQHQLRNAIHHHLVDRVRLLADQRADLTTPFDGEPAWASLAGGRTPIEFAALWGHRDIERLLESYGVAPADLPLVDRYIGTILAGEGDASVMRDTHPDVPRTAQQQRPSLVVHAAATGRRNAVVLAVTHGFNINALGRSDAPCEMPWQTALHTAVERGDAAIVELLLRLGANPSIEDTRFHATPKGWAEHFGHDDIAALL